MNGLRAQKLPKHERQLETWYTPIIYWVKAVGLSRFPIILWKLRFLWLCEILGNFVKNNILSITA